MQKIWPTLNANQFCSVAETALILRVANGETPWRLQSKPYIDPLRFTKHFLALCRLQQYWKSLVGYLGSLLFITKCSKAVKTKTQW